MRRRNRRKNNQRKIIILSIIGLLFIMVVGYSAFQTNLNINVKGNVIDNGTKLYDLVASQTLGTDTANSIDYSAISSDTNGKGVYTLSTTASDAYPVYFYRGEVTNNNVLFGGFCWKIVRTTGTGGTKLIYNGTPTDGTCDNTGSSSQLSNTSAFNSSYNLPNYAGYMYSTTESVEGMHTNTTDSTIKTEIDNWYSSNMTEYTNQIEDAVYCNDRRMYSSTSAVPGTDTEYYMLNDGMYSAPYIRLETNKSPDITCSLTEDSFTVNSSNGNGALTYPVGLLTVDEESLAGGKLDVYNSTYYLNTGNQYWLLSPRWWDFDAGAMYGVNVGPNVNWFAAGPVMTRLVVTSAYGVRPVISLLNTASVTSGDGSSSSPLVVE